MHMVYMYCVCPACDSKYWVLSWPLSVSVFSSLEFWVWSSNWCIEYNFQIGVVFSLECSVCLLSSEQYDCAIKTSITAQVRSTTGGYIHRCVSVQGEGVPQSGHRMGYPSRQDQDRGTPTPYSTCHGWHTSGDHTGGLSCLPLTFLEGGGMWSLATLKDYFQHG